MATILTLMTTRRLRYLPSVLLLASVSLAVGLGLGEFLVRAVAPQITLFPRYVESSEYEIELAPNSVIRHAQGRRWSFTYTTNALGRRGEIVDPDTLGGTCRIVVLGDSFTFGNGVPDRSEYTSVLGERLGASHFVINGGMGGWGLDSHIKWYYQTGSQYRPSIVVLQFTSNDPADDAGLTTIEDGQFAFHPYTVRKPGWQRWISQSSLLQNSHLYSLARRAYDDWSARPAVPLANDSATDDLARQRRYITLLDTYANALHDEGVPLIFLSVTHDEPGTGVYRYDTERFPLIHQHIGELAELGMLTFGDLPLHLMSLEDGSPEGHQWGVAHHRIVGERVAELIRSMDCEAR